MTHLNEMLADGESVGAISRADVDGPQPVERTPQQHATPGEGTSQSGCTLTDEEVEAVRWFASGDSTAFAWGWKFRAETLRNMLERLA
jgi:hypothetical protein